MYLNSVNSSCAPVPGASPGVAVAIDVNRYVPRPGRDKLFVQMPRGGGSAMFYFLRVSFYFQFIQTRSTGPVACKTGVIFCVSSPSTQLALRACLAFSSVRQRYAKKSPLFCRLVRREIFHNSIWNRTLLLLIFSLSTFLEPLECRTDLDNCKFCW